MTATVSEEDRNRARRFIASTLCGFNDGETCPYNPSGCQCAEQLAALIATIRSEARAAGSAEGWRKIVDCVDWIVKLHPEKVTQAKTQSQPSLYGWFVGQTMKAMNGEADPDFVLYVVGNAIAAAPRPAPDETKP